MLLSLDKNNRLLKAYPRSSTGCGLLLFMICIGCSNYLSCTPRLPSGGRDGNSWETVTAEQWQEDLAYLATELPQLHKNAFHTVSREPFEASVNALREQIPSMQPHEVVLGLARIVAQVGDGHTKVVMDALFPQVALGLWSYEDSVRVTWVVPNIEHGLGGYVETINGHPMNEVVDRLNLYIPQVEGPAFADGWRSVFMARPAMLHGAGLGGSRDAVTYTVRTAHSVVHEITLTAQPVEGLERIRAEQSRPLYRQRSDELIWTQLLDDGQTLFMNFDGYLGRQAFRNRMQEIMRQFDNHSAKRLVIDMRDNGGGNFNRVRDYLLPELEKRSVLRQKGSLYVIIGRLTYSAAVVNAVDLRKAGAILVGEPTAGRPNNYGERGGFFLPNSALEISYSKEYYQIQEADTPALEPDVLIPIKWSHYIHGQDPVLEWILEQRLPGGR